MASRKRKFQNINNLEESEDDEDRLFPYLFVDLSSDEDGKNQDDVQLGEGVTTRRQAAKENEQEQETSVRAKSPPPKKEKKDLKQKVKKSKHLSPQLGPSELQTQAASYEPERQALSPVAGPSGLQAVVSSTEIPSHSPLPESSRLVDTDLFAQETPVFENNDFIMFIQKAEHQRQKVIIIPNF